ncbi:MAG: aldo/keto reductase [Gammaproteobacteria bacterium]|jgi:aryl-alcohol dehydrogenase-like predicted oxidoreductase|nr:aldo/keto reductase [Gammaproteobacteria bacterium]
MTISRRTFLELSAGAGFIAAAGNWRDLRAETQTRIMATIPSTGEQVPAIGIGTRDYRSNTDAADMQRFRQTLEVFHTSGGRIIDTSPNYGEAETVIGELLRDIGIRDDVFMATKVDREDQQQGIERMNRSFELLGGDQIDLMQVHNLRGTEAELETMKAWKEQGRFRYLGVTSHDPQQYAEMEDVMRRHPLDFIQINYSLANRVAEKSILPLARDRGVAVLVNLPFARGQLFKAVARRPLPDWTADMDAYSWGQVFLKYIVSYSASIIPIPGTTKPHHAEDNMGAAVGRLPDAALRREIETYMAPLL